MSALTPLLRAGLLSILMLMGAPAFAHEGHDHSEETKPAPAASIPRLEAASGPFQLVALLRSGELQIYLDRFATNEPILTAQVTVETPVGPQEAKLKDGVYRLAAPWTGEKLDLIFTVTEGQTVEILSGTLKLSATRPKESPGSWSVISPALAQDLKERIGNGPVLIGVVIVAGFGALVWWLLARHRSSVPVVAALLLLSPALGHAHDGHDHDGSKAAPAVSGDHSQRLSDGALFVPKPVQRLLAIRTQIAQTSAHQRTLELPGRIMPDPNASGYVQASVSGRLSAPERGFPRLGTEVKAGDVLAFVTPPFQAIDVSDMRQKGGELDQQMMIVQERIARYERLLKTGAVPKVTLDEAHLELQGLRARRAALDKTRAESEKLIAPVSGVIASANAVAGQIAETNAIVFQIVDPRRMWVEALTFTLIPETQKATARTGEGRSLPLSFRGAGLTDRSQAVPVHFAIEGSTKGLRVGQLVTVLASTGEEIRGIALPRTSIVRGANGQTIVFEHSSAERFEPRMVRVEPLDADRVLILDGLAPGRRVVVQGAELLNQVR